RHGAESGMSQELAGSQVVRTTGAEKSGMARENPHPRGAGGRSSQSNDGRRGKKPGGAVISSGDSSPAVWRRQSSPAARAIPDPRAGAATRARATRYRPRAARPDRRGFGTENRRVELVDNSGK